MTYQAGHIKRSRATRDQVHDRRDILFSIIEAMRPMTVRQVFYQATVKGIVEKSEAGYSKVQTDLVAMRRNGQLPYDWLADNTRWQRKPVTFDSIQEALRGLVRSWIEQLMPHDELRVLQAAEQSERAILLDMVAGLREAAR